MEYNRGAAVAYAHNWAYDRNPEYYNFDRLGGDCTNFISQCLYAGCKQMNYAKDTGWYYKSINNRAPAWSGVEFLYSFLIENQKSGPHAVELPLSRAQPGDIIQLSFDGKKFAHSLFVVRIKALILNNILIATHSYDSDNRPLNTYNFRTCRLLHIDDVIPAGS